MHALTTAVAARGPGRSKYFSSCLQDLPRALARDCADVDRDPLVLQLLPEVLTWRGAWVPGNCLQLHWLRDRRVVALNVRQSSEEIHTKLAILAGAATLLVLALFLGATLGMTFYVVHTKCIFWQQRSLKRDAKHLRRASLTLVPGAAAVGLVERSPSVMEMKKKSIIERAKVVNEAWQDLRTRGTWEVDEEMYEKRGAWMGSNWMDRYGPPTLLMSGHAVYLSIRLNIRRGRLADSGAFSTATAEPRLVLNSRSNVYSVHSVG
eukprot:1885288-Rhodomonas_salina.2